MRQRIAAAVAVLLAAVTLTAVAGSPASASTMDPAFPGSWAQWTFHSAGNYNLAMDAQWAGGDGSPIWLYGLNGDPAQVWVQEAAAEGGQFLHPGYNRWLCLGRTGNGQGSAVKVQNCNGTVNQRWAIPRYSNQNYRLQAANDASLCIDVPGSNFSQGQTLQLWGCNGTNAQTWSTGGCYATGCDGQWPDIAGCMTGGADEVREENWATDRLVLIYAHGCRAFWARLTWSNGHVGTAGLRLYKSTAGSTSYTAIPVDPGRTRYSTMRGWEANAIYWACAYDPFDQTERCTRSWWD